MRFTAKTETLRKVVEVLDEIGAKEIDELVPNNAQDLGTVLLKRATAMKQEKAQIEAAEEQVRETSRQISQGKPFKDLP